MMGEEFRLGLHDIGELFAQDFGDALMQDLPAALQEALIGRVLYQRVLEAVARLGRGPVAEHQPGILQLGERGAQRRLVAADDGMEQRVGKFPPDRGADLCDLLHRGEAVEARHQRILQRRGDGERRQRAVEAVALWFLDQQSGWRCHVVGGLVAEEHDENQLLRISVPSGDHSPGDLALSPVHAQLS